jgi:hypothetical protein
MIAKFYNFIVFVLYQRYINADGKESPKDRIFISLASMQTLFFVVILFIASYFGNFSLSSSRPLIFLSL